MQGRAQWVYQSECRGSWEQNAELISLLGPSSRTIKPEPRRHLRVTQLNPLILYPSKPRPVEVRWSGKVEFQEDQSRSGTQKSYLELKPSQPSSFHSRDSLLDKNCIQLSPIQSIKKIIFPFLLCRHRNKKTCFQPSELTETKASMKFYVGSTEKQVGRLHMWETACQLNLGRPVALKYAKVD